MTSESPASASVTAIPQPAPEEDLSLQIRFQREDESPTLQVRLKSEGGRLLLLLPPESETSNVPHTWNDVWQQLKQRLNAGDRFWQPDTAVHLIARDRLLDGRQLQDIAEALATSQLVLKRVYTSRRQTAVAAATAGFSVEQHSPIGHLSQPSENGQAMAEPLYLETTVRSGMEIRHPGTMIVLGDVNPGSTLIADGDIVVWGSLRGVAHAGASGNTRCLIMALRLEPTQLRIGDFVARAPEKPPSQYEPEVAYVTSEGIRITKSTDFSKLRLLSPQS
ncbi:MAG TPA: septum site-determining protein MinC [Synechococcales cyanobacterium M55_K2018_004]|nr:septum site-determining protein MinC [Synechococcales cyanobacterium M55_K2018_004]